MIRSWRSLALMLTVPLIGCQQSSTQDGRPKQPARDPEVEARPGVAEVRKLGGQIDVEEQNPKKPIVAIRLTNTALTDAGLASVASWSEIQLLDLSATKITDAGLQHLK